MPNKTRYVVYVVAFALWCLFIGFASFSVFTQVRVIDLSDDRIDLKEGWYLEVPFEIDFRSRSEDGPHSLVLEGSKLPQNSTELPIPLGTYTSEYHGIVEGKLLPGRWLVKGSAQYQFEGAGEVSLYLTFFEKLKRFFFILSVGMIVVVVIGFHALCYEVESRKPEIEL